jgi:hypothetical protein
LGFEAGKGRRVRDQAPSPLNGFALAPEGETGALPTASMDRPLAYCNTFGTITIDGKTYEHDVIICLSGEVVKRKKKLSKKHYGTSHVLSKDEAKFVFEKGCEQLILGSGQMGNVHLKVVARPGKPRERKGLISIVPSRDARMHL